MLGMLIVEGTLPTNDDAREETQCVLCQDRTELARRRWDPATTEGRPSEHVTNRQVRSGVVFHPGKRRGIL